MPKQDALDDDAHVEMPGFKAKVPGALVKLLNGSGAVVVLLVCLIAGGVYHHDQTMMTNKQVLEALDANTYVLSLPQAERERLNIAMPDSLRRKIRQGRE